MTIIMKARPAADQVFASVRERVAAWRAKGTVPKLAVLLVEGDPASAYYAEAKRKTAEKLGVAFELCVLPADSPGEAVLGKIEEWNGDRSVHGIMLELPLPERLAALRPEHLLAPAKDIDGVTPANRLALLSGGAGLVPATPQACIALVKHYGYALEGRHVALVGRGQTVGMPLFHLLQREQATVTVCHSRTPDLAAHLARADVAFVAVGRPGTVRREMVHPGLVLVDAGINEREDGGIIGDAAPDAAEAVAAWSPVPGGVGTLTTAMLFQNLMKAMDLQRLAGEEESE